MEKHINYLEEVFPLRLKPIYNVQLEGKVVVDITVDQLGNVINAIAGVKGSTTLNSQLLKRAKEAALKTKFSVKNRLHQDNKEK